ncbi:MAG: hypothetical protein JNN15_15895, partial [Blastocatellia bacterium]|nr:hypothetical protein [Blastocatellia bacterium]
QNYSQETVQKVSYNLGPKSFIRAQSAPNVALADFDNYISERAALSIPDSVKQVVLNASQVNPEHFGEALYACAAERLQTLTDQQLLGILRSHVSPSEKSLEQGYVTFNQVAIGYTPSQLLEQIKAFKTHGNPYLQARITRHLNENLQNTLKYYRESFPQDFSAGDSAKINPVQAMVVVYAALSNDLGARPTETLQTEKAKQRSFMAERNITPSNLYNEAKAFGPNGFLHPSDLNWFFSDSATVKRFFELTTSR